MIIYNIAGIYVGMARIARYCGGGIYYATGKTRQEVMEKITNNYFSSIIPF